MNSTSSPSVMERFRESRRTFSPESQQGSGSLNGSSTILNKACSLMQTTNRRVMENKIRRKQIQVDLEKTCRTIQATENRKERVSEARAFISSVAMDTQKELEFRVSELASLAVSSVFPGRYEVRIIFEEKRGKTEARLVLVDPSGNEIEPEGDSAGGIIDILSLAFRVTMVVLSDPANRVMILDEPFQHLSKDLHPVAAKFVQTLSKDLGIQFLIVSHEPSVIESADRLFKVDRKKGVSCED